MLTNYTKSIMKKSKTIHTGVQKLSKTFWCSLFLLLLFSYGNATTYAEDDIVPVSFENKLMVIKKRGGTADNMLVPLSKIDPPQIQQMLSGTVFGEDGIPLIGASIVAKGSTVGTTTDFDGKFELSLPEGNSVIQVSYIGFKTKEVNVSGQTSVTITMEPDAAALEEVVVCLLYTSDAADD